MAACARAGARGAALDDRRCAAAVWSRHVDPGAAEPAARRARRSLIRAGHQRLGRGLAGDARSRQSGSSLAAARGSARSRPRAGGPRSGRAAGAGARVCAQSRALDRCRDARRASAGSVTAAAAPARMAGLPALAAPCLAAAAHWHAGRPDAGAPPASQDLIAAAMQGEELGEQQLASPVQWSRARPGRASLRAADALRAATVRR